MKEQDNIELIRRMYVAFASGDLATIMDHVDDNAVWNSFGPATIPYAGSRSGKAQIRGFFQAIGESTTGGKIVAENFIAQGETVVATGRYQATVRNTGAEIDTPVAHVFTLHDGKVVKWEGFSDTASVANAHTSKAAGR